MQNTARPLVWRLQLVTIPTTFFDKQVSITTKVEISRDDSRAETRPTCLLIHSPQSITPTTR